MFYASQKKGPMKQNTVGGEGKGDETSGSDSANLPCEFKARIAFKAC